MLREAAVADNGDGTYSMALPDGFDPEALVDDGVFTWEYLRQVRYAYDYQPPPLVGVEVASDTGSEFPWVNRIDSAGRIWRIASVDEDALAGLLATRDLENPEFNEGDAVSDPPGYMALTDGVADGTVSTVEYQSWNHYPCLDILTGSYDSVHLWNGESRTEIGTPTARQKALVQVVSPNGICSGTIVAADWVLTAAHCVTDLNTHESLPNVNVYRIDTFAQHTPDMFAIDEDWLNGSGASKNDYALLRMSTPFQSPVEFMRISGASDTVIGGLTTPHNLGFPKWVDDITSCTRASAPYHNSADDLGAVYGEVINLNMDGNFGQSGGPVYYCPEGNDNVCASGEQGYILAVWSAWNSAQTTHRGAKGPHFRDALDAIMDLF